MCWQMLFRKYFMNQFEVHLASGMQLLGNKLVFLPLGAFIDTQINLQVWRIYENLNLRWSVKVHLTLPIEL